MASTATAARGLPPAAQGVLRRRRAGLVAASTGSTLDLSSTPLGTGPYDTVLSIMYLAGVDDVESELHAIAARIRPEGSFLFLEPTRHGGLTGRAQHALAPLSVATSGRRADRDIPSAVRAAGFRLGSLDRFDMPTLWPFRTFVEGRATRP